MPMPAGETAGEHVMPWVNGSKGTLLLGLDGGKYQPYLPSVVDKTRQELKAKGYYSGEINGAMDKATMEAIGKYQHDNKLEISGVPTPRTRAKLFEEKAPATKAS
jgi:hypothetical protein